MDFTVRSTTPELMDDPNLPKEDLRLALKDIAIVNRLLGGNKVTIKALEKIILAHPEKTQWQVVDVGCGDGEVLRQVAGYFKNSKVHIEFLGLDINEKSIERARLKSKTYDHLQFSTQNILDLEKNDLNCDVILCTLTMHHFSDEEILAFLGTFKKLASIGIIVNDLERCRMAYHLFQVFSGIFMKSKIAKHDGRVSIARSFTKNELETYSKQLALRNYSIQWKWAFRYLWVIKII